MDREEIRDKALKQTREKLRKPVEKDLFLVKTVQQLDKLNKNFREDVENFRDLYSQHFPELVSELTDDERFVDMLDRFGVQRSELEPFQELAESSTGSAINDEEKQIIEDILSQLVETKETTERLEAYVEKEAKKEFQNLSGLLNPLLATRLVALAGGLDELAKKPASTVQMLGAEKALFRYLHGEGTPPKHGVLFNHPFVKNLPEEERGKMARFLANKAVMAARIDNYGDEDKSEGLREEARERYEELKN
ncbi:hypothetical protein ACK3SF_01410 [Candidatus Nanosalina sp. VS9-1]|uniref:hypothetical protein n=1 Tax=Candidatus Nanosalina sp. VS9-1 TaxID=3388566 RepID=UPI0039E0CE1F